jgi:hypothetical protein
MDGKIEQHVYIKIYVRLGKSSTETPEMFREAFGEYSLTRTAVFEWHLHFKASRVSVEDDQCSGRPSSSKTQDMLKQFKKASMKTVTKQFMSSQTSLGSVMEFARS